MERQISINEISNILGIDYLGEDHIINGLNLCNRESLYKKVISYVTSEKYINTVSENLSISSLFVTNELYETYKNINRDIVFFITETPEVDFYRLHDYLYNNLDFYNKFNFISKIGVNCFIHPTAFIDDGVIIGDNVTVGPKSIVKRGSIIENNVTIGCNSVVGSEGFQVIQINGTPTAIRHVGGTHIHTNVFIGDNTTVCNSLLEGTTTVGENTKIDNLVHVAHNCNVGKNVVITAGAILCGSSVLEDGAWIGVNSSILNNVVVGKSALIGIGSVVTRNVSDNTLAFGVPAKEKK
ncbi:UDP-3-O-(3-hydroxymyristoyl) glucosamine N-acyltransferase [Cytobacillus suaedae]|nr:UDP-3-O-(3-hydroxymyristoyl) glucosamine N-acyltransferase [Cytobacillus suaedae]